jgi:hypothetical protein
MKQENRAYERDDDEFLDELALEVGDGALDQVRAIIRGDDLHTGRQARREFRELRLDGVDRRQRILAGAHDDYAAGNLALAVELRDAAAHLGSDLDARDVGEMNRHAGLRRQQRNAPEVIERLQVARCPHHVFRFAHLEHRTTRFPVRALYRVDDLRVRYVERAHACRIEHDLVLAHHATHARDLRDVRHGLELVLQEPVLQRAKLRKIHPSAAVDQRVFVNPADARGIRAERRPRLLRQPRLHLVQILEHARARPVGVGTVLEQDVDERIAEERVATHCPGAGHREHRRRQRIRHLVLDDLRRLTRIARADDHLHIRKIGQSVERRAFERPHAPRAQRRHRDQHQDAVGDGPANDAGDHGLAPELTSPWT